jgi:hypothetical protein
MKRLTSVLLVLAFAGVILLPVAGTDNNTFSNDAYSADNNGGPLPPLPPCTFETPCTIQQA